MKLSFINLKAALFFVFFATLIMGCGVRTPLLTQSAAEKERILSTIPEHTGDATDGLYGLYSYKVYVHSVSLRAVSPIVYVIQAEVFDLNKDGIFDSVWVYNRSKREFASTLDSRFRLSLPNTADKTILRDYIGLASYAKRKVAADKVAADRRKAESFSYRSIENINPAIEEKSKIEWFEGYNP